MVGDFRGGFDHQLATQVEVKQCQELLTVRLADINRPHGVLSERQLGKNSELLKTIGKEHGPQQTVARAAPDSDFFAASRFAIPR